MKTGDVVRDAQGRSYQVGPLLGRGLWGKTYLCRQGDSDAECVVKFPLSRSDFRPDVPVTDALIEACAQACSEQARLLAKGSHVFMPPLNARALTAPDGAEGGPVLIMPRYPTSLDRRIAQGATLAEVLTILITVIKHLQELSQRDGCHGALRPTNILLNDRGEVALTDVLTPAAQKVLARLQAIHPEPQRFFAPELLAVPDASVTQAADTYALGMILYRAVMTPRAGDPDGRLNVKLPAEGLDKAALVTIRDRVQDRVKQEDSNPRFHTRLADKLATLLNRAISKQTSPSPPFRFSTYNDLLPRLEELRALIRPNIGMVGKVLLQRPPSSEVFETDEEVRFSVTVGVTDGVETYEEIACGIALFDSESDERLRDVDCGYTVEPHPSGRFRFSFRVGAMAPGRYRARLAFAIRDSGHQPSTTEVNFEVRAAAGYVPPAREHSPTPLPFARQEDEGDTAPDGLPNEPVPAPIRAAESLQHQHDDGDDSFALPTPPVERPAPIVMPPRPAVEPPRLMFPPQPQHAPPPAAPKVEFQRPSVSLSREVGAHRGTSDETLAHLLDPNAARELRPNIAPPAPPPPPAAPPAPPSIGALRIGPPSVETERTEPAVSKPTQLPAPDPLADILRAGSWTELPLPGKEGGELDAPLLADEPEPTPPGPVQRLITMVREDPYLQWMSILGAVILALFIVLSLLDR